jgi:hypothetical protein
MNINEHTQKIYADYELEEGATIRNFRIVQTEGSRQVSREVKHYSLRNSNSVSTSTHQMEKEDVPIMLPK